MLFDVVLGDEVRDVGWVCGGLVASAVDGAVDKVFHALRERFVDQCFALLLLGGAFARGLHAEHAPDGVVGGCACILEESGWVIQIAFYQMDFGRFGREASGGVGLRVAGYCEQLVGEVASEEFVDQSAALFAGRTGDQDGGHCDCVVVALVVQIGIVRISGGEI